MISAYTLIVFISFAGILLCLYIYRKKRANKTLVCPLNSDCNAVLHSEYSSLLGIPLEILGMFYYSAIAVSYGLFLVFPALSSLTFSFLVFGVSIFAFLFSLYLIYIQAFALREWCVWCLTSALLSTLIVITTATSTGQTFVEMLTMHKNLILSFAVIGLAFGLGASVIYNIFFLKFLKDFRISEIEKSVLKTVSQILWIGIIIVILSGLGIIFPNPDIIFQNGALMVSLVVIAVLIVSESTLNILVAPELINISFGKKHNHYIGELHYLRRMSFALSMISLFSWLSFLAFLSLPLGDLIFAEIFLIYLLVLGTAVIISQILDFVISRQDI